MNDVVLVGFDVHAIQAYVIVPIHPIDMSGGSWLFERFRHDGRRGRADRLRAWLLG
ncbi:hypothetical protein [Rhabdothermincola sp.]|uniref:hypothetical protein n=1 Tax=Rhabdothermincola sp. TaxID=2820405 RepID=UPI002FE2AA10